MAKDRSLTVIDTLYNEFQLLLSLIDPTKEPSLYAWTDNQFRRVLVMSIGSYFENEVSAIVENFIRGGSVENAWIVAFAKSKGINRQYHTYFEWEASNANKFFSMFGENCKNKHKADVKADAGLDNMVLAFIQLGALRNSLAHMNFAAYTIDKTAAEVYAQFKLAIAFLSYLDEVFDAHKKENAVMAVRTAMTTAWRYPLKDYSG